VVDPFAKRDTCTSFLISCDRPRNAARWRRAGSPDHKAQLEQIALAWEKLAQDRKRKLGPPTEAGLAHLVRDIGNGAAVLGDVQGPP
jgi:hypothetical protein